MNPAFVFLTVFTGLLIHLALLNQVHSLTWLSFVPDVVLLFLIFWAMRIPGLWFIWFAWGMGLLQSIATDEVLGLYSIAYAVIVFSVQHARLRLVVVSQAAQFGYVTAVLCGYQLFLYLAFRFSADGVQLPLLNACAGAVTGWFIINLCLQSSAPLSKGKDLFS